MAHHPDNTPPIEGERRTATAGLRQVDADGQAQRIQQVAFHHCLDKLGGRVEMPLAALRDAAPDRDVVIRSGTSLTSGEPIVIIELRRNV